MAEPPSSVLGIQHPPKCVLGLNCKYSSWDAKGQHACCRYRWMNQSKSHQNLIYMYWSERDVLFVFTVHIVEHWLLRTCYSFRKCLGTSFASLLPTFFAISVKCEREQNNNELAINTGQSLLCFAFLRVWCFLKSWESINRWKVSGLLFLHWNSGFRPSDQKTNGPDRTWRCFTDRFANWNWNGPSS